MTTTTPCDPSPARPAPDSADEPRPEVRPTGEDTGEALLAEKETERVRLRQFASDDLDDLAAILAKRDVMRHLGLRGEPMTRHETQAALLSIAAHWRQRGFGRWAAVVKATGRLIGLAGLRSLSPRAELVYLLDRPYWGRGLATEVARECLRFAFAEKGFAEVVAFTRPANIASRRVLEKVGMRYCGEGEFFRLLEQAGDGYSRHEGASEIVVSVYCAAQASIKPGGEVPENLSQGGRLRLG